MALGYSSKTMLIRARRGLERMNEVRQMFSMSTSSGDDLKAFYDIAVASMFIPDHDPVGALLAQYAAAHRGVRLLDDWWLLEFTNGKLEVWLSPGKHIEWRLGMTGLTLSHPAWRPLRWMLGDQTAGQVSRYEVSQGLAMLTRRGFTSDQIHDITRRGGVAPGVVSQILFPEPSSV